MNSKTRNIIGWVLTGLLAFVFLGSAIMKLTANADMLKNAAAWGISAGTFHFIAFIEIISFLLFAIPRTGVLGTLLLAAYMGGAIATHLEHGLSVVPPVIVEALVWITAAIRFPELSRRLLGSNMM